MNSKKVKEIVKFSLQKNLQNKWFIILNILIFITILFSTNTNNIKEFLKSNDIELFNDAFIIEIIDRENLLGDRLFEAFETYENITLNEINVNEYTKDTIPKNLMVIEVNSSEEHIISTVITSKEGINNTVYYQVEEALTAVRNELFADRYHIGEEELSLLSTELYVERVMLGVDVENSSMKELIKTISTVIVYTVSIFIFSRIANEIAQEKVSKSIEYVLTSVSEKEYLLAKIISIISLVLLQGIYFFIYYVIGNMVNNLININMIVEGSETVDILAVFQGFDKDIVIYILTVFVYGILTLILMSLIQAALSSKTTNMSEAGNTITFLMSVTVAMYLLTLFLITPYTNMSPIIYIISCIPLVSNYFIPAIIIIGQANAIQIIVSLLLLIISIPISFKVCAKIFKNGVLDYKPNQKERKKKKERTLKEEQEYKLMVAKFRKYAFVIGLSIILWMTAQVIGQYLVGALISPLFADRLDNSQLQLLIIIIISVFSMIIPIGFLSLYTDKKKDTSKINLKEWFDIIFIGIFLMGVVQLGIPYLYDLIRDLVGIKYNVIDVLKIESTSSILTKVLFTTAIAIVPAIFEELLFRKSIINYSEKMGTGFAVIISAIAFALIHMNISQAIFAFVLGIVFGIIYVKTKNIWYTIKLHFLNNGYAVLMQIFIDNEVMIKAINIFAIACILIGLILAVAKVYKYREKIKKVKFDKTKFEMSKYKYIFSDYTFILAILLTIICFSLTENILINM